MMKYDFKGYLIKLDDTQIPANIHLKQKDCGSIYADCLITDNNPLNHIIKIKEIKGSLDCYEVKANCIMVREIATNSSREEKRTIMCKDVVFKKNILENTKIQYRFKITNFKFIGNQPYKVNKTTTQAELKISINGIDIIIRPVSGYKKIIKDIEYTHNVAVSADLLIEGSMENKDNILQIVDNVCSLLSLAKGTKINWISYTIENNNGEVLEKYCSNRVTKSYSILRLIGYENPSDLKEYLESTYASYVNKINDWKFNIIIEEFVDAAKEGDYLEFRGLKLAANMEFILGKYKSLNNCEFYIPEDEFNEKKIKKALNCKLSDILTIKQIGSLTKGTKGLNRRTFKESLIKLYEDLKFILSKEEKEKIKSFIELRNNLVHRSDFQPFKEPNSRINYCFMLAFVSKIILGRLGYVGDYIDWSINDTSLEKLKLNRIQYQ